MTNDKFEKAIEVQDKIDDVATIAKSIELAKITAHDTRAESRINFTFGNGSCKNVICYHQDTQLLKKILDMAEKYYLDRATALREQFAEI